MFMDEELLRGIEQYGRWNVQEFVARSQEMVDVLAYLRAERTFRMFKVMSFITVDSKHFSKRTNLSPISDESEGEANTGARDLRIRVQPISQSVQRRGEVCAEDGLI